MLIGKSVQDAFGMAVRTSSSSSSSSSSAAAATSGGSVVVPVVVVRLNPPKILQNRIVQVWQNGFANLADFLEISEDNEDEGEEEKQKQKRKWRKITFQVREE